MKKRKINISKLKFPFIEIIINYKIIINIKKEMFFNIFYFTIAGPEF